MVLLVAIVWTREAVRGQLAPPADGPVRCARFPALSPDGSRICFSYQGNLWVVPSAGGDAFRLTVANAYDTNPRWSPDGSWIAFESNRSGATQVYLIPSVGGAPRQLTFHTGDPRTGVGASVGDWSADGKFLTFTANRDSRFVNIYILDIATGRSRKLVDDESHTTAPRFSPDGKWVIFQRGATDIWRKGYRGSGNFDVWVTSAQGGPIRRLTDWLGNDLWPRFSPDGKSIYYVSDRGDKEFTLFKQSFNPANPRPEKPMEMIHAPADFIRYPSMSADGKMFAFECDHRICTVPSSGGTPREVAIYCRTDGKVRATEHREFTRGATEVSVTKDGKRAAFVVHGEVFSVSTETGGESRRLTETPVREEQISWSPDGKQLAFISRRDGSANLYVMDAATRETKRLTRTPDRDENPRWSPDGKTIAFLRTGNEGGALYLIPSDGSGSEKVLVAGPQVTDPQWSPDGKWIAYVREDSYLSEDIWVIPSAGGTPHNITQQPGSNDQPRWFPDGSKIAFRSDRTRNREREKYVENGRYAVFTVTMEPEKDKASPVEAEDEPPPTPSPQGGAVGVIDFNGIAERAKQIVALDEAIGAIAVSPDGKSIAFRAVTQGQSELWSVAAGGGSLTRLALNTGASTSPINWVGGNRIFFLTGDYIQSSPGGGGGPSLLNFSARMDIDLIADRRVAFDEAWKELNDRFYDPKFHGRDWKAIGDRYRALVDWCCTTEEFTALLDEMFGELNASHLGVFHSTRTSDQDTAYIGVRFDDRYEGPGLKIAHVMPKGPADRDESRLKTGEYILEVDGKPASLTESFYDLLNGKVSRRIRLVVNDKPSAMGARSVFIRGIGAAAWRALGYEEWVRAKREMAEKLSGSKVAYMHVIDMTDPARFRFEKELFSLTEGKEALVLDVRFNTGGNTHDALLRILERTRPYFRMKFRGGREFNQPERAWTKPTVLLINERSVSDAEIFPNGFRELGLGKIVGEKTNGYVIFTNQYTLIDGTVIRRPFNACLRLDGTDLENYGVPPDIRVENAPDDNSAGRDPQLERAVKEAMAEIGRRK